MIRLQSLPKPQNTLSSAAVPFPISSETVPSTIVPVSSGGETVYREAALADGTVVPFSSTAALVYGTVVPVSISNEMVSISGELVTISMNLVHGIIVPVYGTVILYGDFKDYDGKKQGIGIFFCHMNDCNPLLRGVFLGGICMDFEVTIFTSLKKQCWAFGTVLQVLFLYSPRIFPPHCRSQFFQPSIIFIGNSFKQFKAILTLERSRNSCF